LEELRGRINGGCIPRKVIGMKGLSRMLKNDGYFLRKLQAMLEENFQENPVLRKDYRLFMSQQFRMGKEDSHEILNALVEAGLAKNKNRGIYLRGGCST